MRGLVDSLVAVGRLHLDLAGADQPTEAFDMGDPVLLEEVPDSLSHLAGDSAAALLRRTEVEAHVLGGDPVLLRVFHLVDQERAGQHRLGRDAADVQADAAELFRLHASHPHPEL